MEVSLESIPLTEVEADALVVGIFEGEAPDGDTAEVNRALNNALSEIAGLAADNEMSGKKGEIALYYTQGRIPAKRVAAIGLGKRADLTANSLREASGAAARFLRDKKVKIIATALHRVSAAKKRTNEEGGAAVAAVVEGAVLAMWEPDSYRAESDRKGTIDRLIVVEPDEKRAEMVTAGIDRGRTLGESANFTRTLVNEPGNALPPVGVAERARTMAHEVGLPVEILDEDDMFRLGMGAILAVSVGSENRARLIAIKHMPNPGAPVLALVGKGITFDTGGISIKPTEGMGAMKGDMAGAAAVLGAMRAIALLKLPVNVVGIASCAENMPDGKAYRPGDVVKCMNGKTVEIITTDAEGRLVLADALTYAIRNLHAERVVDVATLTGACVIALGHTTTGAVANNPELMTSLKDAADAAGEYVWELPHHDEYKKQIKSDIADIKNSGGRPGGSITAGLFLREFVEDMPWVHLDIAGTSTAEGTSSMAKGPTGVMVRTFVRLAESLASR
jgi:leucyl aminopeptidase